MLKIIDKEGPQGLKKYFIPELNEEMRGNAG